MGSKDKLNVSMWIYLLPIILALTSVGCSLSSLIDRAGANAEPTPTRTPMPTFTPTPAGLAFVQTSPTPFIPPTPAPPSPTPTMVVQPTQPAETAPTSEPTEPPATNQSLTITLTQNMNVRTGPGTNYPIAGPGPAGETAKVLGRNADSSWLQVEYPLTPDGTGWVYASLVQINGDPTTAQVVQANPPPVAAAPAPQPQQAEPAPAPAPSYQFTPTGWFASENAAIVHFKGRIKDEGGNLINGYSVLLDNDSFSVLSHPTGASRWYPDKGDGEWDVVLPNLYDAQGWWKVTVVRYDCPGFFDAGFDAQCKQFTRLSEDIRVEVRTPEESIINADWTCHWECDKGLYVQAFRR